MDGIHETTIGDFVVVTVVDGRYRENGYIVVNRRLAQALVIDPGGRAEDFAARVAAFENITINSILLTHGHFDHLGAASALSEHWDVACLIHRGDQKLVRQAPLYALRLIGASVRTPKRLETFQDVDSLAWAEGQVGVLQAPGHTLGSVCFTLPGMIFTGDALLREHVGPTIYPGSDQAQLLKSIDSLLGSGIPDAAVIFAGHGRPWTIGEARVWWAQLEGPPAAFSISQAS